MADENIIMMNALDSANEPRNIFPNFILNSPESPFNANSLNFSTASFDYTGADVTVESFLRLLTGRQASSLSKNKQLNSDSDSNILIYLTGHGGDEFLKFRDQEEMSSADLSYALSEMHAKGRYKSVLLVADTCQAATLGAKITSPEVTVLSSSLIGENSYAYYSNDELAVAVIDRFTYSLMMFLREPAKSSRAADPRTLSNLYKSFNPTFLRAKPFIFTTSTNQKYLDVTKVSLYFGALPRLHAIGQIKIPSLKFQTVLVSIS
jgi:phosphatidylinositol glycan class K